MSKGGKIMFNCIYCGEEIKKIESIGLEVGQFILNDQEQKKVKFSISIGNKKAGNIDCKHGSLEEAYYCNKCNKAIAVYNL